MDAVVGVGDGKEMALLITNHGSAPARLERGEILGSLQPATLVEDRSQMEDMTTGKPPHIPPVAALWQERGSEERVSMLFGALGLDQVELSQVELDQLRGMVVKFADLFALDTLELGRISIVTHTINTGDTKPVRQLPRRIPFSLRGNVCQLIVEMLKQKSLSPHLAHGPAR